MNTKNSVHILSRVLHEQEFFTLRGPSPHSSTTTSCHIDHYFETSSNFSDQVDVGFPPILTGFRRFPQTLKAQ